MSAFQWSLLLCLAVMAVAMYAILRRDDTHESDLDRARRLADHVVRDRVGDVLKFVGLSKRIGGPRESLPGDLLHAQLRSWVVVGRAIESGLERRFLVNAKSPTLAVQKVQQWGVRVESVAPGQG
ncbi:MAG: hypothetical protein AAGK78_00490 [Planctomycetota bacterium]